MSRRHAIAHVLLLAAVAAGCTDPAPAPAPSPSASNSPLAVVDPDVEALDGLVAELRDTITALRTALEEAAAGDEAALERAAALLVAEVDAVTSVPDTGASTTADADATPPTVDLQGPAPVLPGPLVSREESIQYGDLLTRTLAAARGAGSAGEPVLRFLGDPLAGDLGAWQRAAADQLAQIARVGTTTDLGATEAAVLDLQGEAPRALAWVVHGLTVPEDATEAAGRALAHLAVIDLALDQLA